VDSRLAFRYRAPSLLDDLRCRRDEITGAGVDEADFPFDAQCRLA
jgi:hypothetical protein